jgi:hypothetical protein
MVARAHKRRLGGSKCFRIFFTSVATEGKKALIYMMKSKIRETL